MAVFSKITGVALYNIQGVPEFFEQNLTECSLQLYKHIKLYKGMSKSV